MLSYFCFAFKSFGHLKSTKFRALCSPIHSYSFLGTLLSFLHEGWWCPHKNYLENQVADM